MAHLVIEHLNPLALAEVDATAFPIFRMHEVDAAVLVGAAGGLAPIDILEPFDAGARKFEISAHRGDGAIEMRGAMAAEKFGKVAINFAAMSDRRNNHSHERATSGRRMRVIIWSGVRQSQTELPKCKFKPAFDCSDSSKFAFRTGFGGSYWIKANRACRRL